MKQIQKLISVALLLTMLTVSVAALATPDQPFVSGVSYGEKYTENGAVPSMLNFGYARLGPGESLYDTKTTTVTSIGAKDLTKRLSKDTFYCYAKWQCADGAENYSIDGMLVVTLPNGDYYATYDSWEDLTFERRSICSWFFDVTDCLQRAADDNDGTLPKGQYTFSLFLNDYIFRTTKVKVK